MDVWKQFCLFGLRRGKNLKQHDYESPYCQCSGPLVVMRASQTLGKWDSSQEFTNTANSWRGLFVIWPEPRVSGELTVKEKSKYFVQVGKELLGSVQRCKALKLLTCLRMVYGRFFFSYVFLHSTKILAGLCQVRNSADKPGPFLTQQWVLIHPQAENKAPDCILQCIFCLLGPRLSGVFRGGKKEFLNSAVGQIVLKIPSLESTVFPAPHYTISLAVLKVASGFFFSNPGKEEESRSGAGRTDVGSFEHLDTHSATFHGQPEQEKIFYLTNPKWCFYQRL